MVKSNLGQESMQIKRHKITRYVYRVLYNLTCLEDSSISTRSEIRNNYNYHMRYHAKNIFTIINLLMIHDIYLY